MVPVYKVSTWEAEAEVHPESKHLKGLVTQLNIKALAYRA